METKTNKGTKILVIDDEKPMRRLLAIILQGNGYDVKAAACGQDGLDLTLLYHPDLIILDLCLPDMDGMDVIRELQEWSKVPVIILSAKEMEQDKVIALDAGAYDYVTKPFSTGELLARIRATLRHATAEGEEPVLTFNDLVIDLAQRLVTVRGKEMKLTPTEYELLKKLAVSGGKVLTSNQLLSAVWGPLHEFDIEYLRVYIGHLRRKIEPDPSRPCHIITEPGVGYRML